MSDVNETRPKTKEVALAAVMAELVTLRTAVDDLAEAFAEFMAAYGTPGGEA